MICIHGVEIAVVVNWDDFTTIVEFAKTFPAYARAGGSATFNGYLLTMFEWLRGTGLGYDRPEKMFRVFVKWMGQEKFNDLKYAIESEIKKEKNKK